MKSDYFVLIANRMLPEENPKYCNPEENSVVNGNEYLPFHSATDRFSILTRGTGHGNRKVLTVARRSQEASTRTRTDRCTVGRRQSLGLQLLTV